MRYKSLDLLKVICAFLVVYIHLPVSFMGTEYVVALARIAVPIFLMISGFFYKQEKAKKQIKKFILIFLISNLLFFTWSFFYGFVSGSFPDLGIIAIIYFVVFNESPFSGHLWYLGAILYTYLIVFLADKIGWKKVLFWISPILIMCDLAFGKYSILIFGREYPYIFLRNWLFVGIPFFSIGMLMKEKKFRIGWWGILVFTLTNIFELFILKKYGINATRDQYISTTFLSIAVLSVCLEYKGKINNIISDIGNHYTAGIYIIHPVFITVFTWLMYKVGLKIVWGFIGPFVVYIVSLGCLIVLSIIKDKVLKKHRCTKG